VGSGGPSNQGHSAAGRQKPQRDPAARDHMDKSRPPVPWTISAAVRLRFGLSIVAWNPLVNRLSRDSATTIAQSEERTRFSQKESLLRKSK
jgi:hypothetical protein